MRPKLATRIAPPTVLMGGVYQGLGGLSPPWSTSEYWNRSYSICSSRRPGRPTHL